MTINTTLPVENYTTTPDVITKPVVAVKENADPVPMNTDNAVKQVTDDKITDREASNDTIKDAVEKINKSMPNTEAVFGIHDKTNRVTIKIIDKDTKKVIKEFPPEKTLDLIAKAWEMAGILVDEKR